MQAIDVTAAGAFGTTGASAAFLGGARMTAGAGAGRATIREGTVGGRILIDLKAAAGLPDQCFPPRPISYNGQLFVVVTGAPDTVIVYQD